jgi:uncharacterized protein YodC (DUF2158 family)
MSLLRRRHTFFASAKGSSLMSVLKPGDLVVLKSGGPVMTVDTVNTDIFDDDKVTGVLCAWFVGNKLERARFEYNAIGPAPPQEAGSEKTEPRPAEAVGEYKAMLDEMMVAMNEAGEASSDVSRAPEGRSRRPSAGKDAADATAPAGRGVN